MTSSSTPSAPSVRARANAGTVFSVSTALAPRCAMITGRSAPLGRRHTRKAYHLGNDELNCWVMRVRLVPPSALAGVVVVGLLSAGLAPGLSGCPHRGAPAPEGPSRALASEAGRI